MRERPLSALPDIQISPPAAFTGQSIAFAAIATNGRMKNVIHSFHLASRTTAAPSFTRLPSVAHSLRAAIRRLTPFEYGPCAHSRFESAPKGRGAHAPGICLGPTPGTRPIRARRKTRISPGGGHSPKETTRRDDSGAAGRPGRGSAHTFNISYPAVNPLLNIG